MSSFWSPWVGPKSSNGVLRRDRRGDGTDPEEEKVLRSGKECLEPPTTKKFSPKVQGRSTQNLGFQSDE